jgi:hypothetical protein
MFVRCEECNYENLPQHSFCGMCGAKLPPPQRVEARAAAAREQHESPQAFSRPSLLGLAEDDLPESKRADYLLEDEPSQHRGGWVAALVLVGAVAAAGWHWRAELQSWASRAPAQTDAIQATAPPVQPSAEVASPGAALTANPQPAATSDSGAQNTATAAPQPAASDQNPAQPSQTVTDAAKREPEPQEEQTSEVATAKPALKPALADMTRKATVKNASAAALEVQGEDYLYGRGVQPDCALAGKSLLAAAAQSSLKAQSVLGTMYATGHCVTRDVPAAYRWFAKASHQEPGNVRLQKDLEALWGQMTPEERELAMKKEP